VRRVVAIIFLQFGAVTRLTATGIIYLDAILYFSDGFIGVGHHWYWTGQTSFNMALSALFFALEVVPLTLITFDARDFVKLSRPESGTTQVPYKWIFYFLMAVGFWNFVGAGIFGFLINLPIIRYFETGTLLPINNGHAAMMGVFGMLGIGLIVFVIRQTVDEQMYASKRNSSVQIGPM
jgi:nitric oxide reductase subunit B